ncbi:hypothetical protein E4U21_002696 [Claviceps maximensis]|nr:hypothetical protein E4U21_002696 [Claviceps maximensis]
MFSVRDLLISLERRIGKMSQSKDFDFAQKLQELQNGVKNLSPIMESVSSTLRSTPPGLLASWMVSMDLVKHRDKFAPHIEAMEQMFERSIHCLLVTKRLRLGLADSVELTRSVRLGTDYARADVDHLNSQGTQFMNRVQKAERALGAAQIALEEYKEAIKLLRGYAVSAYPLAIVSQELSKVSTLFSTVLEPAEDEQEHEQGPACKTKRRAK